MKATKLIEKDSITLVFAENGIYELYGGTNHEDYIFMNPAEFNRLAMQAPLANQMRGLIGMVELGGDDKTQELIRSNAKKLLAEIAELEKTK